MKNYTIIQMKAAVATDPSPVPYLLFAGAVVPVPG